MSHTHTHGHSHNHEHKESCQHHGHIHKPSQDFQFALKFGIILNLAFVIIEALFGFWAHSLALLTDAGHNLSDVLGLIIAWVAIILSHKTPSSRHTYGLRRSSIFAALINAIILLIAIGGIAWEAIVRLREPQEVNSLTMIWVAGVGILINGFTAYLFMAGREKDINIKGAYLHMLVDALVSVGVVISGVVIYFWKWNFIDSGISLIVVFVIAWSTWGLLRESIMLAFDAVPNHINPKEVLEYLKTLPGVIAVHDLHIWAMSTTETALTVHLVKPDARIDDELLSVIKKHLLEKFNISHTTVQFENGDEKHPCNQAKDGVV